MANVGDLYFSFTLGVKLSPKKGRRWRATRKSVLHASRNASRINGDDVRRPAESLE